MLSLPGCAATRGAAQTRHITGWLIVCALGLPTTCWLTERQCELASVACASAAEDVDDEATADAEGKPSERPEYEIPAHAAKPVQLPIEYFPRPTKIEAKIIAALDTPTNIDFTDTPLENCFAPLQDFHKINIWLDRAAIAEEGGTLDQPVTLKLAGVRFRSVLKLLLEPIQLSYVIEDDVLKITTPFNANKTMITRIYPVRDLYGRQIIDEERQPEDKEIPKGTQAAEGRGDLEMAIARTIDPDSWNRKKGPASMTYVRESGSLVIHQSRGAHYQILQLLRGLRAAKSITLPEPDEQGPAPIAWKLRGPRRGETYSLVGIMDLDGDGIDDSGRLRRLIKAIGGRIDNEVDERGLLRIDGKIPDEYKPRVTEKTKFVVIGAIPEVTDLSDPDEIQASLKIAGLHKDIEDQARARGVRIVSLDNFLRYIGYAPGHERRR
jgi:hypothetical protein